MNFRSRMLILGAVLSVSGVALLNLGINYLNTHTGELSLRAGIIRGSGDVYPAARSQFNLAPYRFEGLQNELRSLNKVGPSPAPPEANDKSFDPKMALKTKPADPDSVDEAFVENNPQPSINDSRFETDCTYYEFIEETRCTTNFEAYRSAVNQWEQSRNRRYQQAKVAVKAWEQQQQQFENARQQAYQKAYKMYRQKLTAWVHQSEQHLDQVLTPQLKAQPVLHVYTDLDGKGQLKLPPGEWFLSGGNATNFTLSYWNEMPVTMTRKAQFLELANDTSEVQNRNWGEEEPESMVELLWAYTPPQNKTAEPLDNALIDVDYVKSQLSRRDAVKLKTYEEWSLLHVIAASAPAEKQAELTHLLLLHGADPQAANQKGDTPLHVAVKHDGRSAAMLLLAYGADVQLANKAGNTPLHEAVLAQSVPMVSLLLRQPVDQQRVNLQGKTPLDLARQLENEKIVTLLAPVDATAKPTSTASPTAKPTTKPAAKPTVKPTAAKSSQ
jgi:hypothetical protein